MMTFDGFVPPTKNYFSMPNNWIDICAEITNLAELKVIQYVLRHTWGYREYGIKKVITTDEFMHGRKRADGTRIDKGTGLSNRSVIDGLRLAESHGYLESDLDDSDKARKAKSYGLKMQADVKILHTDNSDVKNVHSGYEETTHHGEDTSYQREDTSYRSEKNTLEKHLQKDTTEKQDRSLSGESDAPAVFIRNEFGEMVEVPVDLAEKALASQRKVLDLPEPNLPIELQEWKEKTDKHKAVNSSHSQQDTPNETRPVVCSPASSAGRDTPAQPGGTPSASTSASNGAVQDGKKRTRTKKPVEAKPAFELTSQQKAFWNLWCNVWFNQDVTPELNETAYEHVKVLAPYITSQEDMDSLEKHARKQLMERSGISRREVYLGNCVTSYQTWKQSRQKAQTDANKLGDYYYIQEAM